MMSCGVGTPTADSLSEWFSFIGLGGDQHQKGGDNMDSRTDRTPETVVDTMSFTDHDDDDDDDDINETTASIISKQLSFIQCIPVSSAAASSKPKFHRQCNPTTCRMTSGMCVDCAQCLNHCVCGDNAKLLPSTCDTPDCSPIVCSDCMRCNTHCTCYCDPNLLRGGEGDGDGNNSLSCISFDPPSITNKPPHQSSIKIKKVVDNEKKKDNKNNPKANKKNKNKQDLELSRRTHSMLSDDDDDDDDDEEDEDEENGKNGPINSRHFTDTSTNETQSRDRMANTRIVSIGGRNIETEVEEQESNIFGGCDDTDDNDDIYAEIEISNETMSSMSRTSPITTFDFSTNSVSISPTRASASTAPRNNTSLGGVGRKRSWLPHLNRRRSTTNTSSRNKNK
jgi:hypothetical protein